MRYLALDFGTKRIGLAVSDESNTFAFQRPVMFVKEFWQNLVSLLQEEAISHLLVGLPVNMDGQDTEKTREVKEFAEKLKQTTGLPVEFVDERLSSSMAENSSENRDEYIDSVAAQIFLQHFLDKIRNTQHLMEM